MKIECIARRGESLPQEYLDPRVNLTKEADFRLTFGKQYVVYALAIRHDQIWYYVVDDCDLWLPIYKPAPLFKIIDARVSRYWRVKLTPDNLDHSILFAFQEWVSDRLFYERLNVHPELLRDRAPIPASPALSTQRPPDHLRRV
jgi:hypothetical protein